MKRIQLTTALLLFVLVAMAQNPVMLKDVYPGSLGGLAVIPNTSPLQIAKTSGYTFFTAEDDDADPDKGLYRTDGTPEGTIKLDLKYPGFISTKAEKLTALGNKVVFAGDNFPNYGEVWVSDGTQGGTMVLENFKPTQPGRLPVMDMAAFENSVFYGVVNSDNHALLKKTDGTVGGTSVVYDFGNFSSAPDLALFKTINGILYFNVYDIGGTGIDQLWRTDGTTEGTYMVKDFGTGHSVASYYMQAGNAFYIIVVTEGIGNVLWKSDGTPEGTYALKTIGSMPYDQSFNNNYPPFAAIGPTLYFMGLDAEHGKELWKTDGTPEGTMLVADINPGVNGSNPNNLILFNNMLYFSAASAAEGAELWKYDGSAVSLVKDINLGIAGSNPAFLVLVNDKLVFRADNGSDGMELWTSDGTAANTVEVANIHPAGSSIPSLLTPGNPVYFSADNGTNGREIYKFDISDFNPHVWYVNDNSTEGDKFTTAVGHNSNAGTPGAPFASINYALSRAQAGDVIHVDAGNYTEQVIINKSITIKGADRNLTTIIMPNSMVQNFLSGPIPTYGVVYGIDQENVVLQDLAVDGQNKNFSGRLYAIALRNTGGEISGVEVKNFKNNHPTDYALNSGSGIFISSPSTPRNFSLHHNNVHDYYFSGMILTGSALTVDVHDNELEGNGVADFAQYGIRLSFGTGAIYNNTISNMVEYTAQDNTEAAGITVSSASGSPLVYNNTIVNCEAGIITDGGNVSITNNDITGNIWYGIESYAQGTANASLTIENNTISDGHLGMYIFNVGTGAVSAAVSNNSLTNYTEKAILADHAIVTASCNWLGTAVASEVAAKLQGVSNYQPWLTSDVDADATAIGFQPEAGTCNGTPVVVTLVQSNNITCNGAGNGSIDVNVSGGTPPYNFSWTKEGDAAFSASSEDLSALQPGSYQLTVTDAYGSTDFINITVTEPPAFTNTINGTNVLCNGAANGTASVIAEGGTAPYSYLWSNGATAADITNLAPGVYSVTVTDANGCTTSASYTVTQPAPVNAAVSATNITCAGSENGSITITARGGTAPYQYSFNDGGFGNGNSWNSLVPGSYKIIVKDANNCEYTTTVTITEPAPLSIAVPIATNTCTASSTGSIDVTVSGGTTKYSYSWTGPNGFTAAKEDLTNLAPGIYNLIVTDANGCQQPATATVEGINAPVVTPNVADVSCYNTATGSIRLDVTGEGVFIYSWTGPNGFKASAKDISGLKAGSYKVVVSSEAGCTTTGTYTVAQPAAALKIAVVKTDITSCEGMGSITVTASGGTGAYEYKLNEGAFQSSNTFEGLFAGTNTITVRDSKGCEVSTTASIVDNGSDAFESNNKLGAAAAIEVGKPIQARIAPTANDKDWYKFTTANAGAYVLTVTHDLLSYTFNLYDSKGKVIVASSSTATTKTYNSLLASATYYVQVSGTLSLSCYTLSLLNGAALTTNNLRVLETKPEETNMAALSAEVYPNPHQGSFTIRIASPEEGNAVVELFNINGQKIAERKLYVGKGSSHTVKFTNVQPALLFYRVNIGQHSVNGKVIGIN